MAVILPHTANNVTMLAIKLKTETATVGEHERIGFTERGTYASTTDTIAQGIAKAITALHHYALGRH